MQIEYATTFVFVIEFLAIQKTHLRSPRQL